MSTRQIRVEPHIYDRHDHLLARIVRLHVPYTRRLGYADCRQRDAALTTAREWVTRMLAALPEAPNSRGVLKSTPMPNKHGNEPVGVSRCIRASRNADGAGSLFFSVNYINAAGKARTKKFTAGPLDKITQRRERKARADAIAFRRRYERAVRAGVAFDPNHRHGAL